MPTIITHAIVPIAIAVALGPNRIPLRTAAAGAVLAMLPDADVAGMVAGVDYGAPWGHRGASHSLVFAALIAAPLAWLLGRGQMALTWLFLAAACASHGLLDMATNGGLGVALWWPWDEARYFWGHRPIRVSPIGAGFFTSRGVATLLSELRWIIAPACVIALSGWAVRRLPSLST
jgi:inner membrane protein